jgi:hypothetical protein
MTAEERKNQYRQLCREKKINFLFLQPWWLDATGPWDVSFALRNNRIVGALPFATGKRWGIKYIGMPSLTHHMRLWMEKPPDISAHKWLTREKQIIWSLIENLPQHGFFSMVFTEDSFDNWLPFYWKDFRQEMRYTFIIDQMNEETVESQSNRNIKRNLKEASGEITIEENIDSQMFYEICRHTYKRQKMDMPYSFKDFTILDGAIAENKAGLKLGAYSAEKKLIGVSYLLWDNETAYYFLAGDNDEGRSKGAGIFLCREALRIAFEEKKLKKFDFCGSMIEPITEIRRQFGARAVPLMKIFKANYRWLDILYKLTH